MTDRVVSRRSALTGALAAVAGGVVGYAVTRNSAAAKAKRGTTAANAYGPSTDKGGKALASLADIPPGSGRILDGPAIVLVRGQGDDVHAFSAICTHQGCTVDKVANGTISCPCHGSKFDAATGDVTGGPAPKALPSIAVEVRDGEVFTA